jgi:hypothetical protein
MLTTQLASESRRAPALAALRARVEQGNSGTGAFKEAPKEAPKGASSLQGHNVAAQGSFASPTVTQCNAPFINAPAKGSCARGLAYERKVGRALKAYCTQEKLKLWDHQWFVYKNGGEIKYFQPDFIIERKDNAVLIEVKLTFVDTTLQVNKYLEYLKLFGLDCFPVTIVRHLTPLTPAIITEFNEMAPNTVLHLWI